MAFNHIMNAWAVITLVSLLACVQASFPHHYSSSDNPLGRHRDWELPLSNGNSSLSPPTPGVELRFMAVVRGTWNWTCQNSLNSSRPHSIGGVGIVIDTSEEIQDMHTEDEYYDWVSSLANVSLSEFTEDNYSILGDFVQLEEHLGYSDFRPHAQFWGTMSEIIHAPHDAPKGPDGSNAILWGRFNATRDSWGVQQIYRVKTAGGQAPHTCHDQDSHLEVPFAASAWIYN